MGSQTVTPVYHIPQCCDVSHGCPKRQPDKMTSCIAANPLRSLEFPAGSFFETAVLQVTGQAYASESN
jgi:hypothetical protein